MSRSRPSVLSARLTRAERALLDALAVAESEDRGQNVSVCAAVQELLMPAVRSRLAELRERAQGREPVGRTTYAAAESGSTNERRLP